MRRSRNEKGLVSPMLQEPCRVRCARATTVAPRCACESNAIGECIARRQSGSDDRRKTSLRFLDTEAEKHIIKAGRLWSRRAIHLLVISQKATAFAHAVAFLIAYGL